MRKAIPIIGAILIVLIGGLLLAPQLVPSSVYRDRIQAEASKALGREVKVDGRISVSVFPRIEARAAGASIANPAGFGDAPFASMKQLRAAVKLWPLLFRRVEVDEFVLVEPNIALVKLENGANNWTFVTQQPPAGDKPKPDMAATLGGDVRIIDGKVSYDDRAARQVHTLSDFDLRAQMKAMNKPLKVTASGLANDNKFKVEANVKNLEAMLAGKATDSSIKFDTVLLTADLKGTLALGPKPAFDFAFDGDVPSAPALADAFKVANLPARAALGKINAKGQATGSPTDITLKIASARHASPLLNADFKGDVRLAQFISLAIDAKVEAPKLADLARAMNIEAPASGALGKATATTKIAGQLGDLTFTDVKFRHTEGQLDMEFDGSARLAADLTYDGRVAIKAPDLRKLAAEAGAKLPEGNIYRSFSLSGDTSGGTQSVLLKNAVVEFDDIKGQGEAALTFGGARPKLVGALSTNVIDITPYATASGAPEDKKKTGGWGDDPIDLTPLRLADAQLGIKAQGVKFQKFDFGPSNLAVDLNNGKLVADLKQTRLFGGAGGAVLTADGSGAVPAVALKADIAKLSLKPLLTAAANFDRVEGAGDLSIDITGKGATLQSLMNSLAGGGKFAFDEGTIRGVDLPELVKSAANSLKTKSIPLSAFGDSKSTKFDALDANWSMKDGVAAMADLKLDAGPLIVAGGGSLDIGRQKLALSLFPEFKNKNEGVKGYGLPVKLAGDWDGVGLSLDFDWLAQRALSDVRTKVEGEIEKELKKQLGGDFAGIFGSKPKTPEPAAQPAPAPAQPDAQPPADSQQAAPPQDPKKKAEDKLKGEVDKALGKLFGN